eukprot:CAMPEP_0171090444 /NCGR_PEP_ID=MMETSP0766_2-20121228/31107_1 /TAXON_ID=439317 /ORGANISM="Gambierdiscus australes, Strain CAWD 149" /LENGTH=129 /DNA_ID=CAMNT_0011548433 /DNA_START=63 /DNA_END=450 /DNA_ORIENTATION=+
MAQQRRPLLAVALLVLAAASLLCGHSFVPPPTVVQRDVVAPMTLGAMLASASPLAAIAQMAATPSDPDAETPEYDWFMDPASDAVLIPALVITSSLVIGGLASSSGAEGRAWILLVVAHTQSRIRASKA